MKRLNFAIILICLSVSVFSAQSNQTDLYRGALIPAKLKPLLTKRLRDFVEIQQRGEWERLFDFLSVGQKDSSSFPLTGERKQCIAEQFKTNPILNFTTQKTTMTTANFNRPLNKKVWFVQGDAELKTSAGKSKQPMSITVRYFNQNWFLSIPEFYYRQWQQKTYDRIDLLADRKELLKVIEQSDSPVEVMDISVKIDPTSFGLRDYNFKVRNKTEKKILSYGYKIIEAGQRVYSSYQIAPSESASSNGFYRANHLFCEDEERPVRIFITGVRFNDRTEWRSKLKQFKPF